MPAFKCLLLGLAQGIGLRRRRKSYSLTTQLNNRLSIIPIRGIGRIPKILGHRVGHIPK